MPGSSYFCGAVLEEDWPLFEGLGGLLQQKADLWCFLLSEVPAFPLHPPASEETFIYIHNYDILNDFLCPTSL